MKQIDELHKQGEGARNRLEELEALVKQHKMADMEFDIIQQMLSQFSENIDDYNVEQKRAAIRTFVKKVVWDGKDVHLYLFGENGDIEFPEVAANDEEGLLDDGEGVPSGEN